MAGWASECPDVKNYKWRLNQVCHRMLSPKGQIDRLSHKTVCTEEIKKGLRVCTAVAGRLGHRVDAKWCTRAGLTWQSSCHNQTSNTWHALRLFQTSPAQYRPHSSNLYVIWSVSIHKQIIKYKLMNRIVRQLDTAQLNCTDSFAIKLYKQPTRRKKVITYYTGK